MVPTSGVSEAEDPPSSLSSSPNMLCRDGKPRTRHTSLAGLLHARILASKLVCKHRTRLVTSQCFLCTCFDAYLASEVTSTTTDSCCHRRVHMISSDMSKIDPSKPRPFPLNSILDRLRYPIDAPSTCILHALQPPSPPSSQANARCGLRSLG